MKIIASNFRPFARNTLVGFVDLEVADLGLKIREWGYHKRGDSCWVSSPGRKYADKAGQEQWTNTVEFASREAREAFQAEACAAVTRLLQDPSRMPTHDQQRIAQPHP